MGNSHKSTLEKRSAVDEDLEDDKVHEGLTFKVLLLGAGESGKSTILKQLRLLAHAYDTLDKTEIRNYITALHANCIDSMAAMVRAAGRFGLSFHGENARLAEHLAAAAKEMNASANFHLDPKLAHDIHVLWQDPTIQQVFERRSEYWLLDGCAYYMERAEEFAKANFWPTEEDFVMARGRTTGIVVTDFPEEPLLWKVVDVGGQRSERKKWIRCFDDVRALLLVVNLSGYDAVLFEDETRNRMEEELQLLEETVNQPMFHDTPIFIFFNKKDVFEARLAKKSIKGMFPNYPGDEKDANASMEYVAHELLKRIKADQRKAPVGHWFISARLKKDVHHAFADLKDALRKANQHHIDAAIANLEAHRATKKKH